eukprot:scaffold375_cov189-Skeletonema_marinoi.AAC.22
MAFILVWGQRYKQIFQVHGMVMGSVLDNLACSLGISFASNNPFEYWITYNEPYENLMSDVESFLEAPGDRDVPVQDVFNEDMFSKLDGRMQQVGWESVRSYWDTDFKDRKI